MTIKKKWDNLMEYSLALAAGLVMTLCGVALLFVVGLAVVITKILVFIK
jgi:hypothetical protein